MTLRVRTIVLLHVWPYDFYDTTLSTEKQRPSPPITTPNKDSGDSYILMVIGSCNIIIGQRY